MNNSKWLKTFSNIMKEYIGLVAIIFMAFNFLLWHTNVPFFATNQYKIFNTLILVLLSAVLLNLDSFNLVNFVKDNILILLIIVLAINNSYNIIIDFKGTVVDMGERANELLMQVFPHILMVIVSFKFVKLRQFIIGLIIVVIVTLGYVVFPILSKHFGINSMFGISIAFTERAQSILNNPNALGEFAFLGMFSLLFIIISFKNIKMKFILSPIFLIYIYGIILSGSRTAIYMSIVLVFSIIIYYKQFKKSNKVFIIFMILSIIVMFLIVYFRFNEILSNLLKKDMSLSGREKIWYNTLRLIKDYGIKGIGFNNFTYVYKEVYGSITSPHNMLLGIYIELGFFCLVLTAIWFVSIIIKNHNNIIMNTNNEKNKYYILFNAFYITYFIGSFTEYSFLKIQTIGIFLFMLYGLNMGMNDEVKNKKTDYFNSYIIIPLGLIIYLVNRKQADYSFMLISLIGISFIYSVSRICFDRIIAKTDVRIQQ